jgi:hypothetical protein
LNSNEKGFSDMRHDIQYKVADRSEQKRQAKANTTKAKKRKSQEQLMLEAAQRNRLERKSGKAPTLEIYC